MSEEGSIPHAARSKKRKVTMHALGRIPAAMVVGFLVCLAILYVDLPFQDHWRYPWNDLRTYLLGSPKGKLWAFLVCIQTTTWCIALSELWHTRALTDAGDARKVQGGTEPGVARLLRESSYWSELWPMLRSRWWTVLLVVLPVLALPIGNLFFPESETGLAATHHHVKIAVLSGIAFPAVLLVTMEMFRIEAELIRIENDDTFTPRALTRFVEMRKQMSRLLLLMGAMFSALAIGTGAFRNSWNSISKFEWAHMAGATKPNTMIEIEDVLLYCACYSMPIFLSYFPAYSAFVRTGRRLVDQCAPTDESTSAAWLKSTHDRADLEKSLQLDTGLADRLKSALILLSPVLTGVVSLLLPTK